MRSLADARDDRDLWGNKVRGGVIPSGSEGSESLISIALHNMLFTVVIQIFTQSFITGVILKYSY